MATKRRRGSTSSGSVAYVNRDGAKIAPSEWTKLRMNPEYCSVAKFGSEWTKLRMNPEYCSVAKFGNDKVEYHAEWVGKQTKAQTVPEEYWKLFFFKGFNIITVGEIGNFKQKLVEDPTMTKGFRHEYELMKYFNQVLIDEGHAVIEVDDYLEKEELVITGNKFAEYAGYEKKTDVESEGEDVGSW